MTDARTNRPLRVFLCHASDDKPVVRTLYRRLRMECFDVWFDQESLLPGQNWRQAIPKAVGNSDVVIVCLSRNSINKTGYVQIEIKLALDEADRHPEGTIFLIPLRLEECAAPNRLSHLHWVDLYNEDGYERLRRALQARADGLGLTKSTTTSDSTTAPQSPVEDEPPSDVVNDQIVEETRGKVAASVAASAASASIARSGEAVPLVDPTRPLSSHTIGLQQPWKCPAVENIFDSGDYGALDKDDLRKKARIINDTLQAFGVKGKVVEINRGPASTQFGVEPGFLQHGRKVTRVKVNQITALADDLALALAAKSIRVEASAQGKNMVVIELPNHEIASVALRDVIESKSFQSVKHKGALPIALGLDVSGQAVVSDLASLPHLLIAGTTGSGKSVCVNAIISCLITHFSPAELRLLMVDSRRVELTIYNGVPHLIAPVVVDLKKVTGVLNWVTREMEERYRKMAQSGSRNIDVYNMKINENNAKKGATLESILPYIVVVIDDLTDLMMRAYDGDEIEKTICHLAQMARAVGIHLIITAQPTAGVVTCSIKVNFPVRIAFSVVSAIDSRLVLDKVGAEKLRGRGDMLYVSPESESPQRSQGCFVSDKEIHKLVEYWKGQCDAEISDELNVASKAAAEPSAQTLPIQDVQAGVEQAQVNSVDKGELLQRATDIVRVQKKASISMLQRQLRIGYARAARLIDQMEANGIVGPATDDSRWREVLMPSAFPASEKLKLPGEVWLSDPHNQRVIGGMEFVRVPAGKFIIGSKDNNKLAADDEKPQHVVEISYDYWLARYPVTNEQFAKFVVAAAYRFDFDTNSQQNIDHPVVQVSWYDALEYCKWLTSQLIHEGQLLDAQVRLPSEAEWEKAARGIEGNEWPWGNEFDQNVCNSRESNNADTTSVGKYSPYGDSPYGAADMVGNVWEWTISLWGEDPNKPHFGYPYQSVDGRENLDASDKVYRILRGGAFADRWRNARAAFRSGDGPSNHRPSVGFRVVIAPSLS